ncbi:hypothetical protein MAR_030706 [Mya arenaria]|uniref:Uncharacterized protein n=1 Tax=Mya arenaria TaxID=6604 RepID=A0ABY7F3A7_MYAAR|nr:hypothetical protein MAR_030706 [Mya arenaria]
MTRKVEENVYYIGTQDIEKRKVKVEELAAFVAGKTLDYYEEEFDKFSDGLTRSCEAAKIPRNRAKNRHKGLYAYDSTRVKKEKCEQYWPNIGTTLTYIGVKVTCQSKDEYAEFTRRLLLLNDVSVF